MKWDGVYLMTEHQVTGERLTAADVRAVSEIVATERPPGTFEIAANVFTLDEADGGRAINEAMAEAGATWTVELTPDSLRRAPPPDRARPSPAGWMTRYDPAHGS